VLRAQDYPYNEVSGQQMTSLLHNSPYLSQNIILYVVSSCRLGVALGLILCIEEVPKDSSLDAFVQQSFPLVSMTKIGERSSQESLVRNFSL
jgi:hypothetical protein